MTVIVEVIAVLSSDLSS